MQDKPDPRLLRLMEQYEAEKQRRINAERTAKILKTLLVNETMRTAEVRSVQREQRPAC